MLYSLSTHYHSSISQSVNPEALSPQAYFVSCYEVETHLLIIIPDAGISESLGGLADAARLLAGSR